MCHYWYQLAEVEGLAGNIRDVHTARAEYFILIGSYEKAERAPSNSQKTIFR